ncbi:MAG TPA: hypothetical protein DCS89_14520 [Gammaproteobacteria bacterium]|jgi:hypothetical protein|nr:hypothetical protein [Gammaproteobacteria bacterium]
MCYLAFVLLIFVALVAESEPASLAEQVGLFPASELVEQETTESTGHLLVLGALKKVNHDLQPEEFILVPGRKDASTWYLPEARRTKQVAEHFKSELVESANILFECQGRSCGSSSYWANKLFERAILYGPEQYQHYLIAQRSVPQHSLSQQNALGDYIVIYIGERATRKIYVHIEYISWAEP